MIFNNGKKDLIFKLTVIILDVLFTVSLVTILASKQEYRITSIIIGILLLLLCYILTAAVFIFDRYVKSKMNSEELSMLNNVTLEFIQSLDMPVLITDEDGNTVWYNDRMNSALKADETIEYGDNIANITDGAITANDLFKGALLDATINEIHYEVMPYSVNLDNRSNVVAVFKDKTLEDKLQNELKMSNPVVSYIVVDNLGDLYSNLQEKNREASNKVASVLADTAKKVNGLLREYERDRYIFVFEYRYLLDFIEKKFDLLDEVREATETDSDVPMTISMGVACDETTFADKVESAKQALELALQRGGDQAVVKYAQDVDIFGGKNKTIQKRTKLRSRVIAAQLETQMKKASNVLIMGHKQADHDAIGASIGMARLAMYYGAKANIVCDMNDANYKYIISDIVKKPEYRGYFIDSVAALDMLEADTLVVVVDVNNTAIMEEPQLFMNASNVMLIDHHRKTTEFDRQSVVSYIDPSMSSTCEMISEILEQSLPGGVLLKEEANILLSGIWLDTNQFSKNSGPRTFGAAQYLREQQAEPSKISSLFKHSLDEVINEARFESNIAIYLDHIAISAVNDEIDKISASKAANKLVNSKGIVASFVLFKTGNSINISARSNGVFNVEVILKKLGGGGHFDMAGAQIDNTDMGSVLKLLKETIDEYMKNEN